MKGYVLYVLLAIFGLVTSFKLKQNEIKWYGWNEGYSMADQKNKLVLVHVYTNWCGWCRKMENTTYIDRNIVREVNENFVAIKVNPEQQEMMYDIDNQSLNGYQLMDIFTGSQLTGYPITVIIDPKLNNVILFKSGYQDAAQFKQTLDSAIMTKRAKF